jgi:hypothetical protein
MSYSAFLSLGHGETFLVAVSGRQLLKMLVGHFFSLGARRVGDESSSRSLLLHEASGPG